MIVKCAFCGDYFINICKTITDYQRSKSESNLPDP